MDGFVCKFYYKDPFNKVDTPTWYWQSCRLASLVGHFELDKYFGIFMLTAAVNQNWHHPEFDHSGRFGKKTFFPYLATILYIKTPRL